MKNKKTGIIIGIVAVVVIVAVSIVSNLHTCAECGKTYIGKEYKLVSVWGDSETVCKDCYNNLSW